MKNLHRKTAQQTYATMPRKNAARHCGVSTWSFSLLSTLFLNKNGAIKKKLFASVLILELIFFYPPNVVRDKIKEQFGEINVFSRA